MIGPLYKYTKTCHLESFLETGSLRIGTLYDFRKEEEHGNEIGESSEGKKKTIIPNVRGGVVLDSKKEDSIPNFLKEIICNPSPEGDNGSNLLIFSKGMTFGPEGKISHCGVRIVSDGPVSRQYDDEDCYILSLSKTFNRDAMRQFGYDACFVIHDVEKFINSISDSIRDYADFDIVSDCTYKSRILHHEEDLNIRPSLLKDKGYSYQQEVRIIWKSKEKNISPFIKHFPKAIQYCSIKNNPLIAEIGRSYEEVESSYRKAVRDICGEVISENILNENTSLRVGNEKGEMVLCWKNMPVLTFGRIRSNGLENWFVYKTYLE